MKFNPLNSILPPVDLHPLDCRFPLFGPRHYVVSPGMRDVLIDQGIPLECIHVIHEPYGPWQPEKQPEQRRRVLRGID